MKRARTPCSRSGRTRSSPVRRSCSIKRATKSGSRKRKRRSCAISTAPVSARYRARRCCRRSGVTIPVSRRTRSRRTFTGCGRSSRRTPPLPPSWSPRQAATSWCPNSKARRRRSKQERKMATQNPNRLRTNCPGGSLTLGGDTTVNRLGFGAMRLCGPGVWGEPLDRPGAKRVLMRAVELGITLIDTADAYGPEVNERFIAETLYPYPKGLIIATKGGLLRPRCEAWENNGRPEHLRAACEASLRRLKLERIDIYQLHAPDPQVPLDESVSALAELQSEG